VGQGEGDGGGRGAAARHGGAGPGRGSSEIVVFGRRAVLEALEADTARVHDVRVSRGVPADWRRRLAAACREAGVELESVRPEQVSALSREPRHDQGVAARVQLQALQEVESFVDGCKGPRARHPIRVLALDGITNSQNIGMIVRSAVAAGLDAVLWPTFGSPWVNGLVVKASASTVFRCPIVRCESLARGLGVLQAAGFVCAGLAGDAAASLWDWPVPHRAVFVVGAETSGISEDVRGLLDARVSIPMQSGVESLNVAVAASLVCFYAAGASPSRTDA
jgi:23S rRNA (guanosine2251-2'-O)-methyltransferase